MSCFRRLLLFTHSQYIFLILAIFALDLATGLLAIIFQERLVASVRLKLASKLRSDYGVHASFTAALDYVSWIGLRWMTFGQKAIVLKAAVQ